jgi:hypothetical protein
MAIALENFVAQFLWSGFVAFPFGLAIGAGAGAFASMRARRSRSFSRLTAETILVTAPMTVIVSEFILTDGYSPAQRAQVAFAVAIRRRADCRRHGSVEALLLAQKRCQRHLRMSDTVRIPRVPPGCSPIVKSDPDGLQAGLPSSPGGSGIKPPPKFPPSGSLIGGIQRMWLSCPAGSTLVFYEETTFNPYTNPQGWDRFKGAFSGTCQDSGRRRLPYCLSGTAGFQKKGSFGLCKCCESCSS